MLSLQQHLEEKQLYPDDHDGEQYSGHSVCPLEVW